MLQNTRLLGSDSSRKKERLNYLVVLGFLFSHFTNSQADRACRQYGRVAERLTAHTREGTKSYLLLIRVLVQSREQF